MKSSKIYNGTPPKIFNPYVLMERFNLGKEVKVNTNYVNQRPQRSAMPRSNHIPTQEDVNRLFNSYVLLERLSPHEIQNLSSKKQ